MKRFLFISKRKWMLLLIITLHEQLLPFYYYINNFKHVLQSLNDSNSSLIYELHFYLFANKKLSKFQILVESLNRFNITWFNKHSSSLKYTHSNHILEDHIIGRLYLKCWLSVLIQEHKAEVKTIVFFEVLCVIRREASLLGLGCTDLFLRVKRGHC